VSKLNTLRLLGEEKRYVGDRSRNVREAERAVRAGFFGEHAQELGSIVSRNLRMFTRRPFGSWGTHPTLKMQSRMLSSPLASIWASSEGKRNFQPG
jgi:hypothetical protein